MPPMTSMPRAMLLGCTCVLLGPVACSDGAPPSGLPPAQGSSGEGEGSTTMGTSSTSGDGNPARSTNAAADDTGSTTDDSPGVVFLIEPDGGGVSFECDIFSQDCPPGDKCMPWGSDGGPWNATKCTHVVENPASAGEPCHVEGRASSGFDDCDHQSMCFHVDPATLEGVCTAFCSGSESNPQCRDENHYCPITGDGALLLCLEKCHPLQQECPQTQACRPLMSEWICIRDASGDQGAHGDPCMSISGCDPGLICIGSQAVPPGLPCEGAAGCCTEICDISDPLGDLQCTGAAGGQTCQPWYEPGSAPVGYENVGVCALPS